MVLPLVSGTIASVKKKVPAQKPARIKKQLAIPMRAMAAAKNLTNIKRRNHKLHKERELAKLATSGLKISEIIMKGTGPNPKQWAKTKIERAATGIHPMNCKSYSRDCK